MDPKISAIENRRMAQCIFKKIQVIRDKALNVCRKKKKNIEKTAVFNDEINSGRVIATFRIEFNQR